MASLVSLIGLSCCAFVMSCTTTATLTTDLNKSTVIANPVTAPASGHDLITVTVTVINGNAPAAGWSVFLSASNDSALLIQPSGTTRADGTITGQVAAVLPGPQVISALALRGAERIVLPATATVTFTNSTALSMALNATTMAGTGTSITVTAHDGLGNPISGYRGTVAFRSSDANATLPHPYTFTAADGGRHLFPDAAIFRIAGATAVSVVDLGAAATPGAASIVVTPSTVSKLHLVAEVSTTATAQPTLFSVAAVDAFGNVAPSFTDTLHYTSSDPLAVLPADAPLSGEGIQQLTAIFSTVGDQNLVVSDIDNPGTTTSAASITVTAGSPAKLAIISSPPRASTCAAMGDVVVQVLDSGDNPTTGDVDITLELVDAPAGVLRGALTLASTQGVATFSGLVAQQAVAAQWRARAPGLRSALGPMLQAFDAAPSVISIGSIASTDADSCVQVPYQLQQACGAPADIHVEYSRDGGPFTAASQAPSLTLGTFGTTAVRTTADAAGAARTFMWDATHDLGPSDANIIIRIGAQSRGLESRRVTSTPFFVHLGESFAARTDVGESSAVPCALPVDINHDGILDLVVCTASNQVLVHPGDGNGGFGAASAPLQVGNGPSALASGDVNNDGQMDVVVVNALDQNITVLLGSSAGTLAVGSTLHVGPGPVALALADVNRDGKLDYVTSNASYNGTGAPQISIAWGFGNGAGGLAGNANVQVVSTDSSSLACEPGHCPAQRLALADLNRDGFVDAVGIEEINNDLTIHFGTSNGYTSLPSHIATNTAPQSVAVGDINNDGHFDVVVANADGSMQIFLGLGNGALQTPAATNVGLAASALVLADVDGDGNLDAILTTTSQALAVCLGDGQGHMRAPILHTLAAPASGVAIADLNRDARTDIIAAGGSAQSVAIFMNNRTPRCRAGQAAPISVVVGGAPSAVITADFNEDGRLDAWATDITGGYGTVLLGTGAGSFTAGAAVPLVLPATPFVAGDLNGDGHVDVVGVSAAAGMVQVLLGDGNATLANPNTFAAGDNPVWAALGDLDNDGHIDVVVVNDDITPGISVLLGDGRGNLAPPSRFVSGSGPVAVALGDVNEDGLIDAVTANATTNNLSVLLGIGGGVLTPPNTGYAVDAAPVAIALADLNRDGHLDVAVACANSNDLVAQLGAGDGTFTDRSAVPLYMSPSGMQIADVNHDGNMDLVASAVPSAVLVAFGDGTGLFTLGTYGADAGASALAVADVNGDELLDVLTANPNSGALTVSLSDTKVSSGLQAAVPTHVGSTPARLLVADLNADGHADAVITNSDSGTLSVAYRDATGFGTDSTQLTSGYQVHGVATGDLNRDGWLDVVAASGSTNSAFVYLGGASGRLASPSPVSTCAGAQNLCIADFTGDAIADVVLACATASQLLIMPGKGDGSFFASIAWSVGTSRPQFNDILCADVNADGTVDAVLTDSYNNQVVVLANNGHGALIGAPQFYDNITAPVGLAAGDLDRDGHVDLVVATAAGVLMGRGQSSTFPNSWLPVIATPSQYATVADFDQDGALDLILATGTGSPIEIWLGDGSGAFHAGPHYISGRGALQAYPGDLDSRGHPAWLVVNSIDNTLTTLPSY